MDKTEIGFLQSFAEFKDSHNEHFEFKFALS